jgi:hypothetical protein
MTGQVQFNEGYFSVVQNMLISLPLPMTEGIANGLPERASSRLSVLLF